MTTDYKKILIENIDKIIQLWVLVNSENKIVSHSHTLHQYLGYSEDELSHIPLSDLLSYGYEDRDTYFETLQSQSISKAIINQRTQLKQKNGVIIDVEYSMHQLSHDNQSFWLLIFDNITEEVELQKIVNAKMNNMYEKFNLLNNNTVNNLMIDIMEAVLVSLTAGQGLRFNRAFLFFVNNEEQLLKGVKAIGPSSGEEAGAIYDGFDQAPKTLTEMIEQYKMLQNSDNAVNDFVTGINIPLSEKGNILIQTLDNQKYSLINNQIQLENSNWIQQILSVEECVILPLVWHGKSIGLIIVDNQVTQQKISNSDIKSLTWFASSAANAIESMKLLINLDKSISQVKQANIKIREGQAKLLQKEKLAAMGELVAHMAHEVRGPLAIIGGFARRTYKLMNQSDPHFDSLRRITDTVETLELVINDILDGSQPASESKDVSDFSTAINKVLNLLEVEIQQRHISVNLNIQGNLPKIKIKEHHLFEIISNIVNNAIEAMEQNGLLLILANSTANQVIITIQDTGPGITNENLGNIFKPFYTTREEGTGLGLVVIKKLVEENGGTVEVRSIVGKGTTFIISFPVIK